MYYCFRPGRATLKRDCFGERILSMSTCVVVCICSACLMAALLALGLVLVNIPPWRQKCRALSCHVHRVLLSTHIVRIIWLYEYDLCKWRCLPQKKSSRPFFPHHQGYLINRRLRHQPQMVMPKKWHKNPWIQPIWAVYKVRNQTQSSQCRSNVAGFKIPS